MTRPDANRSGDDSLFLGVIAWPEGAPRREMAQYLADETGLDAASLGLLIGSPPPLILGLLPAAQAKAGAGALSRIGGAAFVCALSDLESLGPTLKVRELVVENGVLHLELWRLEPQQVRTQDIAVLVRGSPATTTRLVTIPGPSTVQVTPISSMQTPEPARVQHPTRTAEKLDLHSRDGRVFQIDGDKFGYTILGEGRGHSDKQNMDAMFGLLRHLAPSAIADDFFRLWRLPAAIRRLRLPMMKINNDDPAFAFYSRWVALMYRNMGEIA